MKKLAAFVLLTCMCGFVMGCTEEKKKETPAPAAPATPAPAPEKKPDMK